MTDVEPAAIDSRARGSSGHHGVETTVATLLGLMGKAHTLAILREFVRADHPFRFTELEDRLGISPNTLSERLKELTESGLVTRTAYNEIPPRVEYDITGKGDALAPIFRCLTAWAEEFELSPTGTGDD